MKVYGIMNIHTNKYLSVKCKGGKYYSRKGDALKKCEGNSDLEVIEFELVEVKSKVKGNRYLYAIRHTGNDKLMIRRNSGDKFYVLEAYADNEVKKYLDRGFSEYEKVIYELVKA